MAQVDTIRPASTQEAGAAVAVPSGTLHGVTSDDSDSTYIRFLLEDQDDYWSLRLAPHTPPTNHQRHRLRGRIRARTDENFLEEDIDLGRGPTAFFEYATVLVDENFQDHSTPWQQSSAFGLATAGALSDLNIGGGWAYEPVTGPFGTEVRTAECYVDIDCRARPDYSPEVRDGAGVDRSGGIVTDTTQPTLYFGGVSYDGLPALDWSVTCGPFSASGSGEPPASVPIDDQLEDGPYTAVFTVRSTIRGSDPFEHVQEISFDVENVIPPPSPPVLSVEAQFGGYRIDWSNPGGLPWDNDYVVAELWRDDCLGSHRIAVVPDGLNGSYFDLAIPQLDPQTVVEQVQGIEASGGIVTDEAGWRYHRFNGDGSFVVSRGGDVEYLIVAGGGSGGGGGGDNGGSGGGSGGVWIGADILDPGVYPVVVGSGGTGGSPAVNGSASTFNGDTAVGGGRGGRTGTSSHDPGDGGSGGGAVPSGSPGSGTVGQGNDGGASTSEACGGGGGAGGPGVAAGPDPQDAGAGGPGIEWPAGSNQFYAGGGGGSSGSTSDEQSSSGGIGGGGFGASGTLAPGDGVPNTGSGGGGGRSQPGGDGGSGVVIVRYQTATTFRCSHELDECDITYRVRYRGYVSTEVELPDTIPADLILAWPGSVGTIPSGWSRVTALDNRYPRGFNGTGTPTATGGSSSHSHTTPGHTHTIGSHSHSLGGSTGTSNASTTSARFNGASQPQADQPHSHSRPSSTSTRDRQNSGSSSPGTSSSSNIPPTRSVIWIQSDGAQSTYPVGVLGFSTQSVSGWTDDASSSGRFLRGASSGSGGGSNSGSSTHNHVVNSHSHSGFNHDHNIGNTGLSSPAGVNAGFGSQTPRWLPRHTHPMSCGSASTGSTNSASGGTTGSANQQPPNRRLRVLRNTGGGSQTRIIGLYLGPISSLDPLLTRCDGTNGTPDMRNRFARDRGSDSVNSTGGSSTHNHSTPNHSHGIGSHNHSTSVGTSNTGSYLAPSFGDLGPSPTTGHTHSSGSTSSASPNVGSRTSGTTNTVNHLPPYREVHFVRLDGTISGSPLPVPELKVTNFSSVTVPSFFYGDDLDRLATRERKIAVMTDRNHQFPKTVVDSVPLTGGLHTVSSVSTGEDVVLTMAVEGKPAIDGLEEILSADRVYYSPVGGTPGWFAPSGWRVVAPVTNVKVLEVFMVRQPWPTTPDPEDFL